MWGGYFSLTKSEHVLVFVQALPCNILNVYMCVCVGKVGSVPWTKARKWFPGCMPILTIFEVWVQMKGVERLAQQSVY